MEIPIWLACVMGMGVVFVGLICLVVLTSLLGAFCRAIQKKPAEAPVKAAPAAAPAAPVSQEIPNRQQFIAAVSAAIAEDLGADVSAIRILSVEKLN